MAKTKETISDIVKHLEKTLAMIKTAKKGHNSLNGTNIYAKKFIEYHAESNAILDDYEMRLDLSEDSTKSTLNRLKENTVIFYNPNTKDQLRNKLLRDCMVIYQTKIVPKLTKQSNTISSDKLFPFELVEKTRDYIEKIAIQATKCYEHSWYDASAVMIRRLLETLIIECFEKYSISNEIKNGDGDFFYLRELINKFLEKDGKKWNVGRNVRKTLPNLKTIGDQSAHSRRFNARKSDIDNIKNDLRLTIEELVSISDLKRI